MALRGACRLAVIAGMASGTVSLLWTAAVPAQYGGGGGWGRGGGGGYASTAQQAADYGMASVVRAEGYANLQNSQAAKNFEQAKTMEIENRMRWTETYFAMRKTNKDAKAAEDGPPVTHEQAIHMAKMAAPPRLGSTQLDPVTGHIEYPMLLQDSIYDPYRNKLDSLFAERSASGGSLQYADYKEMQTTVSHFIDALKARVKDYAAGDYGRARTFLNSLSHELKFPTG